MVISPPGDLVRPATRVGWAAPRDAARWMLLAHFVLRLLVVAASATLTILGIGQSGSGLGPFWLYGALLAWGGVVLALVLGSSIPTGRLAMVQWLGDALILCVAPFLIPVWGATIALLAVLLGVAPSALAAPWTGLAGYLAIIVAYLVASSVGASGSVLEAPGIRGGGFVYGLVGVAAATGLAVLFRWQNARMLVELDRAQDAQAQLGAILDASRDPLVLVGPDGRLIASNRATAETFGMDVAGYVGQPVETLLPYLERLFGDAAIGDEMRRQLDNRDPSRVFRGPVIQRWPVLREYDARSMPVFSADGRYRGRAWVFQDVTEQRARERQREAFLEIATRELRTPLAAMRTALDQLAADPDLAARAAEVPAWASLTRARENAARWEGLVEDLVVMSQLERPGFPLDRAVLHLRPVLAEVQQRFLVQAQAGGVTLTVRDQSAGGAAWADPRWLPVMIGHLVRNAIQYTPQGGEVMVSAEAGDDEVRITVIDTGIGLTAEDMESLFVPYYRSPRPAVQEQPGVGLGLPITKRLVERHGGRITVTSDPGHGTVVRMTLPRAAEGVTA